MKRTGFIVAIILGLLVATSVFANSDYERYTQPAAIILDLTESEAASVIEEKITCVFRLPDSVEIIEEEAFEGISTINIELPVTLTALGERAFANIKTLRTVYIPFTTRRISSNSFEGSSRVTITAASNSYAKKWANTNGLPFVPSASFFANNRGHVTAIAIRVSIDAIGNADADTKEPENSWSRLETIKVVGTLDIIFNSIYSRGPPRA